MATGTMVYDGDCGVCTVAAEWLARHSDGAEVVPWQRLDLEANGLTRDEVTTAVYWLEDGTRKRGARAVAAGLRTCGPAYRMLGRLIDLPPVRPLAAVAYSLVARYRYKLSELMGVRACSITPP